MAFTLSGEIDIATRDQARQELLDQLEQSEGDVRIDLSGVTFMDSAGLGALADVAKAARAAGRSVCLVGARSAVRRLLDLARFDEVAELEP